jgi:tetratricopeptide (TPR) repeat protein
VLEVGLALSEALGHLHQEGLVHRDVKPSNVIFVNGRPKLADIGLVTDASDQCSIVGTEGYLPPEGPGTPQADIFAFGKVLYEAATGLDRRIFPELPVDLRNWPEHQAVVELNEIVLRACAKEPDSRYSSCQEMHDELSRLKQGRSVRGRRIFQQRVRLIRKAGVAALPAIAGAVVLVLWRTMIGERPEDLGSNNREAIIEYDVGIRGLRNGTPDGGRQALEHFGKAIATDPKFVAAYARLFETYLMSEDYGIPAMPGKTEKLNELAATLEKLAPTSADTHAAAAIVKFLNEMRWNDAEKEFKKALKSDKKCRMALTYYGYFLTRLRRPEDARKYLKQADDLYPASADIAKLLGHCEFAQRRFKDALGCYLTAEVLDTNNPSAYYWAGRAYMGLTNYPDAFQQLLRGEVLKGSDPTQTAARYARYQAVVQKDPNHPALAFWSTLLADLKAGEEKATMPYVHAARYIRVGDQEHALKFLNKALDQHDHAVQNLLFDECWDSYRREQWFKDIVKKVGLSKWE